jgi:hypothetical protein
MEAAVAMLVASLSLSLSRHFTRQVLGLLSCFAGRIETHLVGIPPHRLARHFQLPCLQLDVTERQLSGM